MAEMETEDYHHSESTCTPFFGNDLEVWQTILIMMAFVFSIYLTAFAAYGMVGCEKEIIEAHDHHLENPDSPRRTDYPGWLVGFLKQKRYGNPVALVMEVCLLITVAIDTRVCIIEDKAKGSYRKLFYALSGYSAICVIGFYVHFIKKGTKSSRDEDFA